MPRLTLNKTSLHREMALLKNYRRFLPSLELKRQQLMAEKAKARASIADTEREIGRVRGWVAEKLPMLSNRQIDVEGLVTVRSVSLDRENVVGVVLPRLQKVDFETRKYSFMAKPHWVDAAVEKLGEAATLALRLRVETERCRLLEGAVRKVTQRINLFEKVLIPRSEENIAAVKIYLSDQERAGVVRAKLAKSKRVGEGFA